MRREYHYYVYILTNKSNRVLYTGVTNNLERRLDEHYKNSTATFTGRYKTKNWFITKKPMM